MIAAAALIFAACGDQTPTASPTGPEPTVTSTPEPTATPGGSASPAIDYEQLVYGYTYQPDPGLQGGGVTIGDWRGSSDELRQLNPVFAGSIANRPLFAATMRTLFLVTADGHWKPDLAARIPSLSDGSIRRDPSGSGFEVDLVLRPGLLWSDGQPATMDDLAYTWGFARDASPAGWKMIDRVAVTDPTHATVHFSESYGDFIHVLASYFLPAHYFKTVSAADAATKLYPFSSDIAKAVTIGPFKYASISGNSVGLVRDDDWRGPFQACEGGACLDKLTYRSFPNDKAGMIAAFQAGDIDVALGLDESDQAAIAEADPSSGKAILEPAWAYEHFDMNEAGLGAGRGHPALRDVVVRRAIAQAIDREALFRAVHESVLPEPDSPDVVACTNATPTDYWQLPDPGCLGFDVAAANRALDDAGYARGADGIRVDPQSGLPLVFEHCTTSAPFRELSSRFLAAELEQIGIKLNLNFVGMREVLFAPWGDVGATAKCNLAHGNFDTAEFSYALSFNPHDNYYYPYDSAQIPTTANGGTGLNFVRFANSSADAAIDALGSAISPEDQVSAAYAIQKVYVEDVPEVALFYRSEVRGISVHLRNFVMHPGASLGSGADTWNVEDWWLGD